MSIQLLTGPAELGRMITNEIVRRFGQVYQSVFPRLLIGVRQIVTTAITSSPEYQSLLDGNLRIVFGLANPQEDLAAIVRVIVDNIRIELIQFGGLGGIRVTIIGNDYSGLTTLPVASYVSHNTRGGATQVPWLQWLLFEGDRIVVGEYQVVIKDSPSSRAGGLMVRSGRGFRVPPEFSGTAANNWMTRTFEQVDVFVQDLINREFFSRL